MYGRLPRVAAGSLPTSILCTTRQALGLPFVPGRFPQNANNIDIGPAYMGASLERVAAMCEAWTNVVCGRSARRALMSYARLIPNMFCRTASASAGPLGVEHFSRRRRDRQGQGCQSLGLGGSRRVDWNLGHDLCIKTAGGQSNPL